MGRHLGGALTGNLFWACAVGGITQAYRLGQRARHNLLARQIHQAHAAEVDRGNAVDDATKEAQGEQAIVRAEVSKEHGNSVFVEELAAPATPPPHRGWAVGGPRKSFAGSGEEAGPGHDRGLNLA